jgi:hypothetical protein
MCQTYPQSTVSVSYQALVVDDGGHGRTEGILLRIRHGYGVVSANGAAVSTLSFRSGRLCLIEDGILLDVWSEVDPGSGQSRQTDEQMRLAVTALHLPRAMARELGRFPVDAVALEVRVVPATETYSFSTGA